MRNERGLTLVELLVSTLLLSFVILGSVYILTLVLNQNSLAGKRSIATSLAVERIEQLTSDRFRSSADYAGYARTGEVTAVGPPQTLTADFGAIPGYPEYRRVVTLDYGVPAGSLLQVTSEVSWEDLREGTKTHKIVTYVNPELEAAP